MCCYGGPNDWGRLIHLVSLSKILMVLQLDNFRTFHKAPFPKRDFSHLEDAQVRMLMPAQPVSKGERALPQLSQQNCPPTICYSSTATRSFLLAQLCSDRVNIRMKIVVFVQRAFLLVCWMEGVFLYLQVPPQDVPQTETLGIKSDAGAPPAALSQISFYIDREGESVDSYGISKKT